MLLIVKSILFNMSDFYIPDTLNMMPKLYKVCSMDSWLSKARLF
jgi:hypothetical protein